MSSASSQRVKDLEFDLEATRKWAIAAEADAYKFRAKADAYKFRAEAKEALEAKNLKEENARLEADLQYWYDRHQETEAELKKSSALIERYVKLVAEVTRERDALYESLG